MNKKRVFIISGSILLFTGIVFILNSRLNITGAAFGFTIASSALNYISGFVLIIIAGALFVSRGGLEKLITSEEFFKRMESIEADDEKRAIILDTSAIMPYSERDILRRFDQYTEVFVPESVINEIKNPNLRRIIQRRTKRIDGFEKYRKTAENYLKKTEKTQIREFLMPYLEGKKQIKTNREEAEVSEKVKRVKGIMEKKGVNLGIAKAYPGYARSRVVDFLKASCGVSQADTDVLAFGLYLAEHNKHALIGEKDTDLEQAIGIIKKEEPLIGANLDFVNNYAA